VQAESGPKDAYATWLESRNLALCISMLTSLVLVSFTHGDRAAARVMIS
jgi:hypothetical protein